MSRFNGNELPRWAEELAEALAPPRASSTSERDAARYRRATVIRDGDPIIDASTRFLKAAQTVVLPLPVLIPQEGLVRDPDTAWLIEQVESWHEDNQRPRDSKGWFHASALGRPDRELLAQFRGEDGDRHKAETLRIFDNGHGRDRAWKQYLKAAGLSIIAKNAERRIRINRLRLVGECDDVIRNPATGDVSVFEFKTINPFAFGQLRGPKPEHVLQVHCYMAGLALSDAIVCYESKSNQALLAFRVPFSVETWGDINFRLRRLLAEVGMS